MTNSSTSQFIWSAILTSTASRPLNYTMATKGALKLLFTSEVVDVESGIPSLAVNADLYGDQVPVYNATNQNMMIYRVTKNLPSGAHPKGEGWDYINV